MKTFIVIEADSVYLPDRAATTYRSAQVKSSIAIEAIDPIGDRLRHFHGAGYYELSGEDYRGVFRLGRKQADGSIVAIDLSQRATEAAPAAE